MQTKYYSIIDIGSNTMRLVVYTKEKSGRFHEVENTKAVARLRNYLTSDNTLSNDGIERMVNILQSFKEVVDTYELNELVCVATATIRQAKNNQAIKEIVKTEVGWEMQILSEKEEAYYGYLAVVNSTSISEGITIDIGGGSTEITYFKNRQLVDSHSFPFGALTLKDFLTDNKSMDKKLVKLRTYLFEQFNTLDWLVDKQVPLIGIGGSARNLAQIHQSREKYPLAGLHQYQMNDSDIAETTFYLSSLSDEELGKVEGLSSDRIDTIVPAANVFLCLYQMIDAKTFVLSRKGLRDGVFYKRLTKHLESSLHPNVLQDSIEDLVHEYNLNKTQIHHVQILTKKLLQELQINGLGSLTRQDWELLDRACYVYHLGQYIDSESSAQHTFYLLANRTIDGLMHIDRLKLALIASYKNKTVFKQFIDPFHNWFLKKDRKKLYTLGALLKFTYSLDATKRQVVQDFDFTISKGAIILTLYCNSDFMPEEYQANKQKKHLEKALHNTIELKFVRN
ncbi:Ppx/GppA family phosphatase [Oceanobacillus chungangensis]|uniref:Exopolyphosphatase n=1 Tax=Oceanobacillus chungangensis TaxID=1229152 RepID=A0A3D8PIR2_9BACI|nr:Ppx/GppA family phosphatase [Oceanobacillus chungangensis]RDW15532.1 exopolyphosphatase [Oceanobacillus chungangensis]